MLGLWDGRPDAGLEVKRRGFVVSTFHIRIGDRLQIPQAKHVDVGLKQAPIWYGSRNLVKFQSLLSEIEFQEAILVWWPSLKWPPDYIKARSRPGSFQSFQKAERGFARVLSLPPGCQFWASIEPASVTVRACCLFRECIITLSQIMSVTIPPASSGLAASRNGLRKSMPTTCDPPTHPQG